jgi:methionyl aminopeptidase
MIITSEAEKEALIEAGKRLAHILQTLKAKVAPGVTTEELDSLAEELIRKGGDDPSFLGYTPDGAPRPYPATLCVSINDDVVHGIPNESVRTLNEGDIVSLDLGLTHKGIVVDAAITVPVGTIREEEKKLLRTTEEALLAGIAAAVPGNHVGDISFAMQQVIEKARFSVVRELGGHGVGNVVHEDPYIPNYGKKGDGELLEEGMVLALEPIANIGKAAVSLSSDGYTFRTKDGSKSAHFEHTILLEKGGALVVTK